MSTIVSMHTVDLGVWFKIFYYIDRKGAGIRSAYNKIMNPDQCGGGDELSEVKKIEQDLLSAKLEIDKIINDTQYGGFEKDDFFSPKNLIKYDKDKGNSKKLSEFEAKKKVFKFSTQERLEIKGKYKKIWDKLNWNQKLYYLNNR